MGFMDKFRELMNAPEEEIEEAGVNNESEFDSVFSSRKTAEPEIKSNLFGGKSKVVSFANSQMQVVLARPERFEDAPSVADHLNSKRTVVLNLESANRETCRRLIDFLSGVAYANNGQIKRVANSTFIITPFNVDVMGDLLMDEIESESLYL